MTTRSLVSNTLEAENHVLTFGVEDEPLDGGATGARRVLAGVDHQQSDCDRGHQEKETRGARQRTFKEPKVLIS